MKKRIYGFLILICVVLIGAYYYVTFPAINIHEPGFWFSLMFILVVLGLIFMVDRIFKDRGITNVSQINVLSQVFFVLAGLCVCALIVGSLLSSEFFRAKSYASLIKVQQRTFTQDIEQSSQINDIALMDSESARIFGNRKIGSLSEVVSQYEVESYYNQINIDGKPVKVSALKYASFFKWFNNRKKGIPGYVQVNPVNSEAKYVSLKQGMKYVPSGYLNDNLQRHVQLRYPTKIISGYYLEIDDNGNPVYVCPTQSARIGLFGGMDVNGAILCNPVDGSCKYYKVKDIPKWVDHVYDGKLLTRKYDWYGTLSDGFFNSIIGQKGCKKTTDDFGYKTLGDDVWIYTGVTSVNGDQSNIGFVMMNERTSEVRFYKVSGAEEHSAMSAAQGEVQEKGYQASFPSLINVAGMPTYIMVLKDNGGLVKRYAMVNVEQYNMVATGTTQENVFTNYKKLLAENGNSKAAQDAEKTMDIIVNDIKYINTDDGTYVYIKDGDHNVFKQPFEDNESLIKVTSGDAITVTYEPMEGGINILSSYVFK